MASSIDASTSGAGGVITTADNTGILQLKTAGTTAVTVDASQNVGIGTTSPTNRLGVVGGIQVTSGGSAFPTSGSGIEIVGGAVGSTNYIQAYNRTGSTWQTLLIGTGLTTFETNGVERMRVASDGGLYVNSTSRNGNTLQRMGLRYDGSVEWGLSFQNNWSGNAGSAINFNNFSGTQVGTIQPGSSSTSYVTSSDYRLKENVIPMTGALDKIAKLKPVTYTWKNTDGEQGEGFIAHELAEVCPLAVSGKKDEVNKDGSIKPQGIDTSFLVATLTAAIQELAKASSEQQTIINDLKARVTALEGASL